MCKDLHVKVKILALCILSILTTPIYSQQYKVREAPEFNNLIILIGDGLSTSGKTITRWYKQDYLAMDRMYHSEFRTNSTDSLITDSAAAATAFASGCKTVSEMLGILSPKKNDFSSIFHSVNETRCIVEFEKPVVTILEAAKLKGMSVGLVSTSEVQHATPAAFSAHVIDRDDMAQIAKQQVYQDLDVVFGGGKNYILPKSAGGVREEDDDLAIVLKERGYLLISNFEELKGKERNQVWGLFAPKDLAFEIDRIELHPEQPSLTEMTSAAIEILSKNDKGFFLMVEGSKIDWAAHDNDPIGVISDTLAFDDAVRSALEFAKKDGHTLVLVLSDHGCGGISLGNKSGGKVPYHISYNDVFEPLKKARLTAEGVAILIKENNCEIQKANEIIEKYYGIRELYPEQLYEIRKCRSDAIRKLLGRMISDKSNIGWTTTAHTGEEIVMNSNYPIEKNGPIKTLFDNTEIGILINELLNLNLEAASKRLYIDFDQINISIDKDIQVIREISDSYFEILLDKNGKKIKVKFPFNTDICEIDDGKLKEIQMNGITIHLKVDNKAFLPLESLNVLKAVCETLK